MLYKTIVHELLQQWPEIHDRLQQERSLLPTMNAYAMKLRANHMACIEVLRQRLPAMALSQISSEALELALEELRVSLQREFSMAESESLSLDEAMAFIRRHTPPA